MGFERRSRLNWTKGTIEIPGANCLILSAVESVNSEFRSTACVRMCSRLDSGVGARHQSAELLLANVQARNAELTAQQEQLALRYQEQFETEQLEREKLAAELAGRIVQSQGSGAAAGPLTTDGRAVQVAPREAPDSTGAHPDGPDSQKDFASSDYLRRMMADAMKCGAVRGAPVGGRSESV